MFRGVYLLLVVFSITVLAKPGKHLRTPYLPRIVGGQDADIVDYPYQISLLYNGNHACGGSILNENYILTAAHCTYDVTPSELKVRAGSSVINTGGTVVSVAKIYYHSLFDINTYDYDVSVLVLAEPLQFGPGVQPIPMIDEGVEISDGVDAVATGWGLTSNNGRPSTQLQKVVVPTISTKTCEQFYGSGADGVTSRMFCAGEAGKDTCQGDSGGPIVVDGILIGLTSWGDVCGNANTPGVYTKISLFRNYIDNIVK